MNPIAQAAACIGIGVVTGVVSALCGVGGGVIMVPAFALLLGMQQKNAVATSLAAVILTSVATSVKNSGNQLVDWRIALCTGLAAAAVAYYVAGWLKTMSNITLTRTFAVLMIVIGMQMLYSTTRKTTPATQAVDPPAAIRQ